jgi:hypothetical protein
MKWPLILLLAASLVFPTRALPEAQSATVPVSRYLVGSWVGNIGGLCGQLTIGDDGTFTRFIFEDDSLSSSGTYQSEKPLTLVFTDYISGETQRYTCTVDMKQLLLTEGSLTHRFRRLKERLVRAEQVQETTAASADPALDGTWGSMNEDFYSEWTFTGNGECRKFVPFDDKRSLSGTYAAGYGTLVILSREDTLIANYTIDGDFLELSFPGGTPAHFVRKTGPLIPRSNAL